VTLARDENLLQEVLAHKISHSTHTHRDETHTHTHTSMVPFVLTEPDGRHFQPTQHKKLHFSTTDNHSSHLKRVRNGSARNVGHTPTKKKTEKQSWNPLIGWISWPSFHKPDHKTYTETRRRKLETNKFSSVASPVFLSTGQITLINSRTFPKRSYFSYKNRYIRLCDGPRHFGLGTFRSHTHTHTHPC
jgi:hypothetical protein